MKGGPFLALLLLAIFVIFSEAALYDSSGRLYGAGIFSAIIARLSLIHLRCYYSSNIIIICLLTIFFFLFVGHFVETPIRTGMVTREEAGGSYKSEASISVSIFLF